MANPYPWVDPAVAAKNGFSPTAAPDPLVSDTAKQGLKSRLQRIAASPVGQSVQAVLGSMNPVEQYKDLGRVADFGTRYLGDADNPSVSQAWKASAPTAAPVAAAAPAAQPPSVELNPTNPAYPHESIQSNGLRALPQGVVRSSIPGVYLARGKDGSFMASNVMGANGMPDFGGTSPLAQSTGLQRSAAPSGGTSYDPRAAVTDRYGYTMAPGAHGGTYDPNAGVVDTKGAASLPGAASGPTAGFTYAENSLHMNPSDMIKAAGINPEAAQAAKEQLIAAINNDKDASSETQLANRAALAQLQGNEQDVRQQYWGSSGGMYGAMGGAGGGAKGGLGLRDILTNRYRNANLAERTARDQTRTGIEQQQADRAAAAEDRQARDSMLRNFQTALKTDPNAAATIVQQNAPPPNMGRAEFNKWMASDKGKAWRQMFQSILDNGAMDSMWTHVPFADDGDIAALNSGEVGLHRIAFDKNGKFAGMNDADGSLAYPNDQWYRHGVRYNMGAVNSVSPQYLKWIKENAIARGSVPSN